jgi:hypothetical protein
MSTGAARSLPLPLAALPLPPAPHLAPCPSLSPPSPLPPPLPPPLQGQLASLGDEVRALRNDNDSLTRLLVETKLAHAEQEGGWQWSVISV